jgi:RimJ/RimL family protein N-acetyltransferase
MPKLQLRPAMLEDAKMVFAWRNDPFILARGSSQRAVEWDEHLKWFEETVHDGSRKMFIVLLDDNPVGQVRFDRTDEHTCEVSIYLLPAYTGRGIGVVALKTACWEAFAHLGVKRIVALIRKDNQQSVSAF